MELSCLQLEIVESRKNTRHMCVHCHFERKNGADAHADCYDNYLRRKCPNAGGMSSGLSVIHFEIYDSSLTTVVKLLLPALYPPRKLCALSRDYHISPYPLFRLSMYARVILAVHVLSRDIPTPYPLVRESPCMPE